MRRALITLIFRVITLIMLPCQTIAQPTALSREEKIQKAGQYYSAGMQFMEKGQFASADAEFKKAQFILEGLELVLPLPAPAEIPPAVKKEEVSLAQKAFKAAGKNKPKEAISLYQQAIEAGPKDANLYYNLALEYLKTDQFIPAAEALHRVIQLKPKDSSAYYNLGVLYENYFNDKNKALEYYRKYIRLAPASQAAAQIKAWIRQISEEINYERETQR